MQILRGGPGRKSGKICKKYHHRNICKKTCLEKRRQAAAEGSFGGSIGGSFGGSIEGSIGKISITSRTMSSQKPLPRKCARKNATSLHGGPPPTFKNSVSRTENHSFQKWHCTLKSREIDPKVSPLGAASEVWTWGPICLVKGVLGKCWVSVGFVLGNVEKMLLKSTPWELILESEV